MENIPTIMLVVAAAFQANNGRWLMHKRPADKHHGGLWEFPGGKVEKGESPPIALVREVKEELGIDAQPDDLAPLCFAECAADHHNPAIVILLYKISRWTGEADALEGGEIGWFTEAEIEGLEKPPLDQQLASTLNLQNWGSIAQ